MASDPRDYKLSISSTEPAAREPSSGSPRRPFLSIHFTCCGVYGRIYQNSQGTAYSGHCPRCAARVHFPIGPGGSSARAFVVG